MSKDSLQCDLPLSNDIVTIAIRKEYESIADCRLK